jgi:predicted ArsR family transcriptional regulator
VSPDEPATTAAEMQLLAELRQLVEAADETIDREQADQLLADITRAMRGLHSVIERAEQIAALRQAKGLPPVSREAAELLAQVYDQARQLRDQLEQL